MNCKQGDLAVIRPSWGVESERGAVVTVKRRGVLGELINTMGEEVAECSSSDAWLCDSRVTLGFPCFIRDSHLRPIRDSDAQDEMLRLVGLPNQPETV